MFTVFACRYSMPREDKEIEEERKAKTAYDLMRIRLNRLEKNIVSFLKYIFNNYCLSLRTS